MPQIPRKTITGIRTSVLEWMVRSVFPVAAPYTITQQPHPGHIGIDIGAAPGAPVVAPRRGRVSYIGEMPRGYGVYVKVLDAVTGLEQVFAHLDPTSVAVRPGQIVSAGQLLGRVGLTGRTSGYHLHYEVNPPGPERFANTATDIQAIDPWQFLGVAARGSPSVAPSAIALQTTRPVTVPQRQTASYPAIGLMTMPQVRTNTAIPSITQTIRSSPYPMIGLMTAPQRASAPANGESIPSQFIEAVAKRAGLSWGRIAAVSLGILLVIVGIFMVSQSARAQAGEELTRLLGAVVGSATPQGRAGRVAAQVVSSAAQAGGAE